MLWAAVAAGVLAVDQVTKFWAERALDDGQTHALIGDWLQLRLTYNPGAAFSLGTGYTVVLTLIAGVRREPDSPPARARAREQVRSLKAHFQLGALALDRIALP